MAALATSTKYYRITLPGQELSSHSRHKFLLAWDKTQDSLKLYKDDMEIGSVQSTGLPDQAFHEYNNYLTIGGGAYDFYPALKFKMVDLKIWKHVTDVTQLTEDLKKGLKLFYNFL